MVEAVDEFLEILEERSSFHGDSSTSEQINVRPLLSTLAFDLVARTTFGMRLNVPEESEKPDVQFFSDIKGFVPVVMTLDRWLGNNTFEGLTECSIPAVEMRRKDPKLMRPDLLENLLVMKFDKNEMDVRGFLWTKEEWEQCKGKDKVPMPVRDVAGNAANIFQAGFETVGVTLSHCLFSVAKFQDVQDKIRAETEATLAKHGEFTYDAISELQYTAQTILETLRMYTPAIAFTTRQASTDYRYEGILLRKGVSVMACSHQVHHDPNVWERPGSVRP
ncbi:hypothetical protein MTO96_036662 [Rhipicephalus appendiculatus]